MTYSHEHATGPVTNITYLDTLPLSELNQFEYSIVGSGGYVQLLLGLLRKGNVNPPRCILATHPMSKTLADIDVIPLEEASVNNTTKRVVLGSDLFQIELMDRVNKVVPNRLFIDVADDVQASLLCVEPLPRLNALQNSPYAVFITIAYSGQIRLWLGNFIRWLEKRGVSLIIKHPLSRIEDGLLEDAAFIFFWNGSTKQFKRVHRQLEHLGRKATYMEFGHFPQSRHFYFDRNGVNCQSQLMTDSLDWVDADDFQRLDGYRKGLFADVPDIRGDSYVFVPLQVEADSNVQLHSRFRQGMQEYIDYVARQHPGQALIFKPHPKDANSASYNPHHGIISQAQTLSLIKCSSTVRGINSSVLFEAALYGKPVICDGESLLRHPCGDSRRIIAAMLARQYSTDETMFDIEKLKRFSHMGHYFEEQDGKSGHFNISS